jgi:hypothetical protein
MAVTDLEAHPDGEYWLHRGLAAIEAENHAEKQRNKPRGKRGA